MLEFNVSMLSHLVIIIIVYTSTIIMLQLILFIKNQILELRVTVHPHTGISLSEHTIKGEAS